MRRPIATVGLLLAFGVLAGCSSGPEGGPLFNNEGGADISCMAHQTDTPGERYTDRTTREELGNTGEILAVMKYYTTHGAKPYCDGAPATDEDRAWGQLYDDLGGTPDRVPSVLG